MFDSINYNPVRLGTYVKIARCLRDRLKTASTYKVSRIDKWIDTREELLTPPKENLWGLSKDGKYIVRMFSDNGEPIIE